MGGIKSTFNYRFIQSRRRFFIIMVVILITVFGVGGCNNIEVKDFLEAMTEIYKGQIIYVSATNGDDENPGTINKPKATIQGGIDTAYSHIEDGLFESAQVHVAQGTYKVNYQEGVYITMRNGVSLYGGYALDFNTRDSENYETVIVDESKTGGRLGDSNQVIYIGTGITNATVIDGFTIQGGGGDFICAINIIDSSPTIQNNTIHGGSGSVYEMGVAVDNYSSAVIQYNTIIGGNGAGENWGVVIANNSTPLIQYNNITGGSAGGSIGIKCFEETFPTIQHNTIDGGTGTWASGIDIQTDSFATINDNIINAGTGSENTHGILINSAGATITANTIDGGNGVYSNGIYIHKDSYTIIKANTIDGGIGSSGSHGISTNNNSNTTITANTINGGSGNGYTHGIINNKSNATIIENTINGGTGSSGSHGIANNNNSNTTITANTINGGSGFYCHGISSGYSDTDIRNNTIFGGTGSDSKGVFCSGDGYTNLIQNNTIDGGTGNNNSMGIFVNEGATPSIQNNIIFISGTGWNCSIVENPDNGKYVQAIENNDLWNTGSTELYEDYLGNPYNDIVNVNVLSYASGNVDINPIFEDIDGADDDAATMEDNDWHLNDNSPSSVTQGGINLSSEFTKDKDDVTRTAPWSMGAYEKD